MTVKELYEKVGGNYNDAIQRLMSEGLIKKIIVKLADDANFANLLDAIDTDDTEKAFVATHTLKGVCANLSLDELANSFSEQCECFRAGDLESGKAMMPELKEKFETLLEGIKELDD